MNLKKNLKVETNCMNISKTPQKSAAKLTIAQKLFECVNYFNDKS